MKRKQKLLQIALGVCVAISMLGCSSEVPRIDGSSESAFLASHERLLKSLSAQQQLQLTLAEVVVMSKLSCGQQREPIPNLPAVSKVLGGQTSMKACRNEFNGMSYQDIILRSQSASSRVEQGSVQLVLQPDVPASSRSAG